MTGLSRHIWGKAVPMPVIAAAAAYGLGFVGLLWFALDASRIPAMIWFWSGFSRLGWWTAMLVAFAAFGVPALVGAFMWRRSDARRVLRNEIDELKRNARRGRIDTGQHAV
jgi:hypothetical protein